jgi:peptidyl-prolyl cis-trans isomerase SurA
MNRHRTGIMKSKLIFTFALSGILAWAGTIAAKDLGSDRVAAVVNNQVIPLSDIIKNKQPFMRSMSLQLGVIPPGKWPTERELLDELIVVYLLEQEAARREIKIDDRMVDASIEAIRKRNNLTPDKFIGQLARSGINYDDYRKMMKRQLLLSRLIDREVTSKIAMSEEDGQRYFKANRDAIEDQFKKLVESMAPPKPPEEELKPEIPTHEELHVGGKIRLRQIVLSIPANAKPQVVKNVMEKAKRIHSEAMTGADFGQLAQKYSDDPSAKKGGDLGWMDYKDLSPNIQKMVQHLKTGDIYPVQARTAVIVFYLEDAKGRSTKRIPIPEKQRKELERRWKEQHEKRDMAAKQQQGGEADGEEVRREEPKKSAQDGKAANNPKKSSTILTPEEEKEYEKVRNKVIAILRTEKVQTRMKEWINELKKNSVIEVKL